MMFEDDVLFALGLTLFAGLSTGIGSVLAFFSKKFNPNFLSAALGFSAGVMVYISLVDIFQKAKESLTLFYGDTTGHIITVVSFFGGILLILLIDRLVPSFENPHEIRNADEMDLSEQAIKKKKLVRMGLFSALAISIHNFPEGIATFMTAMQDPTLGVSIAIAIAIHNIPEGIAVSVPIYYATGSRKKAFFLSFASGLSEPIGALLGYLILLHFISDSLFGIIFAGVAGIMVYISLDELLPTAEKYGKHHIAIYGLIGGMAVMALSLIILG